MSDKQQERPSPPRSQGDSRAPQSDPQTATVRSDQEAEEPSTAAHPAVGEQAPDRASAAASGESSANRAAANGGADSGLQTGASTGLSAADKDGEKAGGGARGAATESPQPQPEIGGAEADNELLLAQLGQQVVELETALEASRSEAQAQSEQVLRMRAEVENVRRRAEKDVEQARRQGLEKVVSELLQVKDSLEMGVQAAEDEAADRAKLLEGSQLTLKMLQQLFERFSIEEVDPRGERFNPDFHEAMAMQPSSEQEPNTVLHVVQKGYCLHGRVLRPALVIVAKKADESPPSASGSVDEKA